MKYSFFSNFFSDFSANGFHACFSKGFFNDDFYRFFCSIFGKKFKAKLTNSHYG